MVSFCGYIINPWSVMYAHVIAGNKVQVRFSNEPGSHIVFDFKSEDEARAALESLGMAIAGAMERSRR
jgi:hypothetical protein